MRHGLLNKISETGIAALVGALVLAGAIGFGLYVSQIVRSVPINESYSLSASFRSVEGIDIGSDVRLAGVKIGSVTDVNLNRQQYVAQTTFAIRNDIQIPDDSSVVINSEGLLGGNFVEIIPGGSPFFYTPDDEILDTQGAVSLISLLLRFATSGGEQ